MLSVESYDCSPMEPRLPLSDVTNTIGSRVAKRSRRRQQMHRKHVWFRVWLDRCFAYKLQYYFLIWYFLCSVLSALDLIKKAKGQRKVCKLVTWAKGSKECKKKRELRQEKAGLSEQFPCVLVDSKDMREQVEVEADQITSNIIGSGAGTAVPATGASRYRWYMSR